MFFNSKYLHEKIINFMREKSLIVGYSMHAKLCFYPDNLYTERAIVVNVASRYSKVSMRYTMKLVTVPCGGKILR